MIVNGEDELNYEKYVGRKERLAKVYESNNSEMKECVTLPAVGHLDMTDISLLDPFYAAYAREKTLKSLKKAKMNPCDSYLVSSALWLRFLTQLDAKLEPEM